jgi:hypothetical protein
MIGHLGAQSTTVIKKADKATVLRSTGMKASTTTPTARVKVGKTSTLNAPLSGYDKPKTRAEDPFAPNATGGTPTTTTYVAGAIEDGKSATVAMREMRDHYTGMPLRNIIYFMNNGGYSWNDICQALMDINKSSANSLATLAYRNNVPAIDAARFLKDSYKVVDQQMIEALKKGGYGTSALVEAGKTVARYPIGRLLKALKANGIEVDEVAEMVRKSYGRTIRDVLISANNSGFTHAELERVIAITFQMPDAEAARELSMLNYSPSEIADILKRRYNRDVRATAKILHDVTGATVKQATDALRFAYKSSSEDIANALYRSAKYDVERVKETISKAFNLSIADVLKMLGM